jgi:hypothetical protein
MSLGQRMTAALDIMNSQTPYGVANQMQNAQSFADHYGFEFAESEPEVFARWMRPSFDRQVANIAKSPTPYERFIAQELETVSFPDLIEAGLVSFDAVDPLYRSLIGDLNHQLGNMITLVDKPSSIALRWGIRLLIVGAASFLMYKLPSDSWPFWLVACVGGLVALVLPRDLIGDIRYARTRKRNNEKSVLLRSTLSVFRQDSKASARIAAKIGRADQQGGQA